MKNIVKKIALLILGGILLTSFYCVGISEASPLPQAQFYFHHDGPPPGPRDDPPPPPPPPPPQHHRHHHHNNDAPLPRE
ncbi:MAG: hypothetical protein H6Q70_2011 [Firmicutes bacterium]|nr:hypothetical protein [Bacillota bacterium]